jgi:hypothetical protein
MPELLQQSEVGLQGLAGPSVALRRLRFTNKASVEAVTALCCSVRRSAGPPYEGRSPIIRGFAYIAGVISTVASSGLCGAVAVAAFAGRPP